MSDYMRGVEDAFEAVLVLLATCKNLDELRSKIEDLLSEIIQGKTEKLVSLLKERR